MIFRNKKGDALDDALFKAAETMPDDARLFDSLDDSSIDISPALDEKIGAIIDGTENTKAKNTAASFRRVGLRIAIAVIVVIIMAAPFVTNVSAQTREEWKIHCDESEYFFVVRYFPERYSDESARVAPPETLLEIRNPYMSVKECAPSEKYRSETEYDCVYEYMGAEYMTFQQKTLSLDIMVAVTSYKGSMTVVDIGGYDGILFEYSHSDTKFLFWNDGEYAYKMQSKYMTASEMLYSASHLK